VIAEFARGKYIGRGVLFIGFGRCIGGKITNGLADLIFAVNGKTVKVYKDIGNNLDSLKLNFWNMECFFIFKRVMLNLQLRRELW
jgi:hypothetical protein